MKKEQQFWLIKSEGDCYSIDDLRRDKRIPWEGVRNYQARNFMMSGMKVGDLALFHHSNGNDKNPTGVYGLAKVVSKPHPDLSAQNKKDEHFDPKATKDKPIWYCVDFAYVKKFKKPLSLAQIKADGVLKHMIVAQRGSRLSISPVSKLQFDRVLVLLEV